VTAFAAGLIENSVDAPSSAGEPVELESAVDSSCDCCGATDSAPDQVGSEQSIWHRIIEGIRYAFTDIVDDLAVYLLVGYILAGLITAVLGGDLLSFSDQFRTGWGGYMAAIIVGLPLYICATSSTPLAAALLAGGFSPGAILVFLIVGPATNIATLVVVGRMLKRWSMIRYLLTIVVVAVLAGLALDQVYQATGVSEWIDYSTHTHGVGLVEGASAVAIAAIIAFYSLRRVARRVFR
jgi:hypothetical protein